MTLAEKLRQLKRMDQLIQLKATGCPSAFAKRMDISIATIYRYLRELKNLDAPLQYCRVRQTYYYEEENYELKF